MPNIAQALKSEIARLARKEIRQETDHLKKSAASYRSEIAELKRRIASLERQITRASKTGRETQATTDEADETPHRFSAKGFAKLRQRLGLSAADMGVLLGTSGQSVYAWEQGKTRPRATPMARIISLRKAGKREVTRYLDSLRSAGSAPSA